MRQDKLLTLPGEPSLQKIGSASRSVERQIKVCTTRIKPASYLEVLRDFTDETLEGQLADEKLS